MEKKRCLGLDNKSSKITVMNKAKRIIASKSLMAAIWKYKTYQLIHQSIIPGTQRKQKINKYSFRIICFYSLT